MKLYTHEPATENLEACNRLIREIEKGIEHYVSAHEDFDRAEKRFKDIDFEDMEMELLEDDEIIDATLHIIQQVIAAKKSEVASHIDELNAEYRIWEYNDDMQRRASSMDIVAGVN